MCVGLPMQWRTVMTHCLLCLRTSPSIAIALAAPREKLSWESSRGRARREAVEGGRQRRSEREGGGLTTEVAARSSAPVCCYCLSQLWQRPRGSRTACSVGLEPAGLDQLLATSELKPTIQQTSHNQPISNSKKGKQQLPLF